MGVENAEFWVTVGHGAIVSVLFILLAAVMFPFLWKLIDKITPGDLNKEILGDNAQKTPNIALAIVVASMVLAFGMVLAAAIH